jgi:hypothetical protein
MKLRILEFLNNIQEYNGVSISANLRCTCGNNKFVFSHTGKQTKGILAPYITKKNKQLILQAKCTCCGKNIEVYNSTIDGSKPQITEQLTAFMPFVIPKTSADKFEVLIKYNYWPEKLKVNGRYSNEFENCFIYIVDNGKETKALIEE